MSTSGYVVRPSLMKRSNSRSWRMGSTRVMPSTYATIESPALPRPCAGMPRSLENRIRSQQMRKNSARPVRSMTSSSWASCLRTARRERVVAAAGAVVAQPGELENGVSPAGTGKPGKR